jgi:prepilin-type N-terminal cleavage/methylation domain-containing protein
MDQLKLVMPRPRRCAAPGSAIRGGEAGFTLIEAIVAMSILSVALLSLAQAFYLGMQHMSTSSANLVAREKAREAVESVHTARDTRTIRWAQIRNASSGGVFLDGAQPLNAAGADGLVNTADDAAAGSSAAVPGPNGILGDADDVLTLLAGSSAASRSANSCRSTRPFANWSSRSRSTVGPQQRSYTLRTFISSFS